MSYAILDLLIGFILGICSSLAAHLIIVRSKGGALWLYRILWSPPWKRTLSSGISGAEDLEQLIRLLASIESWFNQKDMIIFDKVRDNLWESLVVLQFERLSYLAQFSSNDEERMFAIRQLYHIEPKRAIQCLESLLSVKTISKRLKSFAENMKNEIDMSVSPPTLN